MTLLIQIIVHGSSIAVFTLGKHLNTLSFTITYTQDNGTTQASAHSGAGWAARFPRMSISSRRNLKPGKIGPISAPQDGRPFNSDTMREGGPITMSAIGRQDVDIDTAPEAARRREERRHAVEEAHLDEKTDNEEPANEETYEEKINDGHEAWREGDNIIIEDDQGEVIRTISSPRTNDSQRQRLERLESRAGDEIEGMKGRLKRMWSGRGESSERRRSIDLESGIPEGTEPPSTSDDRPTHQRRSSSISSRLSFKQSPKPAVSGPVFIVDEDNRRTARVNSSTEARAREERDKETEVERRRREAVFGISQDSDDEEQDHPHPRAISRSKDKQPQPPSSSEEEEEEEDPASSRTGSGGAGSSSSGSGRAELLAQPPQAKTRGIRFGDISVGQESFSLEEGPPSTGGTGARHHKTGSGDWRVRWSSEHARNK